MYTRGESTWPCGSATPRDLRASTVGHVPGEWSLGAPLSELTASGGSRTRTYGDRVGRLVYSQVQLPLCHSTVSLMPAF